MNCTKTGKQFYSLSGKQHDYVIMTINRFECLLRGQSIYFFEYHELTGVKFLVEGWRSKKGPRESKKPPEFVVDTFNAWLSLVKREPEWMWNGKDIPYTKLFPKYAAKEVKIQNYDQSELFNNDREGNDQTI